MARGSSGPLRRREPHMYIKFSYRQMHSDGPRSFFKCVCVVLACSMTKCGRFGLIPGEQDSRGGINEESGHPPCRFIVSDCRPFLNTLVCMHVIISVFGLQLVHYSLAVFCAVLRVDRHTRFKE